MYSVLRGLVLITIFEPQNLKEWDDAADRTNLYMRM